MYEKSNSQPKITKPNKNKYNNFISQNRTNPQMGRTSHPKTKNLMHGLAWLNFTEQLKREKKLPIWIYSLHGEICRTMEHEKYYLPF